MNKQREALNAAISMIESMIIDMQHVAGVAVKPEYTARLEELKAALAEPDYEALYEQVCEQYNTLANFVENKPAEPEQEPVIRGKDLLLKWRDGYPPHPWSTERFLAKVKHGDDIRVMALTPLPEEYAYDCTTDEGTYYMKFRVLAWMQMPTSQFISPDNEPSLKTREWKELSYTEATEAIYGYASGPAEAPILRYSDWFAAYTAISVALRAKNEVKP